MLYWHISQIYPNISQVDLMTWRIHLTNQAIHNLHILPGKRPLLAVWTRPDRVHFYEIATGTLVGDQQIAPAPLAPRSSQAWQEYVAGLTIGDDQTYLPYVRTGNMSIYATDDGKLRVYRPGTLDTYLETDGMEFKLGTGDAERFIDLDLDRALGLVAALDETGKLHLFQQNVAIGVFDIGLTIDVDLRARVAVSRGGGNIFATDGRRVVMCGADGVVRHTRETFYYIGQMNCSPAGGMVITSDMESGVLRVYHGSDLTPTHQRFAIDLAAHATQVQLLADLPPVGSAISALACHSRGVFAFAMSGVVVVSAVEHMDELPRPQALH